jgi:peptide-methionine (R)-S-oxide reductase
MRRRVFLRSTLFLTTGLAATRIWACPNEDALMTDFEKLELADKEWRKRLTKEQYRVLRKEGTERAGSSPLDKQYSKGVYHCAGCDLPLFTSDMKFDSGTGWPSFFDVIPGHVGTRPDRKLLVLRTEYHCARCGDHQGHVFNDGPEPTGLRYCNNGVALSFKTCNEK